MVFWFEVLYIKVIVFREIEKDKKVFKWTKFSKKYPYLSTIRKNSISKFSKSLKKDLQVENVHRIKYLFLEYEKK